MSMKMKFSYIKFLIVSSVAITCGIALCNYLFYSVDNEGKDPFKKSKPWEAATFKWSYPDEVWDVYEADEALSLVQKHFEDMEAAGIERTIGGDWRLEGPENIGGRFNAIAVDPFDENNMLAGSCAGGLFKTNDGGDNWNPVTDDMAWMPACA